jgi:hypothetical protein
VDHETRFTIHKQLEREYVSMTGSEALQAMRDGKRVRHIRWPEWCWIIAEYDDDDEAWYIEGRGNPYFNNDVRVDKHWILGDLLLDDWEIEE